MGLIFIPKNELLKFKNLINKNKDKNIPVMNCLKFQLKIILKSKYSKIEVFGTNLMIIKMSKILKNFKKFLYLSFLEIRNLYQINCLTKDHINISHIISSIKIFLRKLY